MTTSASAPYLRGVRLLPERVPRYDAFPFSLPFVRDLDLSFDAPVTFFVGENGTGKSTLLEAIAALVGLPASGGSTREIGRAQAPTETSALAPALRPSFATRPRDAWFFRAETLVRFADLLDERKADPEFDGDPFEHYGGASLHARSHGEAFLAVFSNRFDEGLFLLDEPEAALSPQRQLALLALMDDRVRGGRSQFVVATHAPILLTFPGATLLSFDHVPPRSVALDETSHYRITRGVLDDPALWWKHLAGDADRADRGGGR